MNIRLLKIWLTIKGSQQFQEHVVFVIRDCVIFVGRVEVNYIWLLIDHAGTRLVQGSF